MTKTQILWQDTHLTGLCQSHLIPTNINEQRLLVHTLVARDLQNLARAAHAEGFELNIASGFRDFSRQKAIWNSKFTGQRAILDSDSHPIDPHSLDDEQKITAIMRWSALPGASRHHWGTDFDVYAQNTLPKDTHLKLEPWEYLAGHQIHFYNWLQKNAHLFGFFFPYSKDLGGVAAEPWHISHKAVATQALHHLSPLLLSSTLLNHPIEGSSAIINNIDNLYVRYISNISID
ncbi:M15 family metallopeptidase [Vibrio gallicus]|uniref:M15 family metallopeptidase n=1 Tax=Vibrio gallicus TaxID=190897 RepID=UPI0021C32E96|nr:M15 family metallopeptidase [Vibrio gallicus]